MNNIIPNFFALSLICLLSACDKSDDPDTDTVYNSYQSIIVDGRERSFLLNLPPNYMDSEGDFALVIGMHGGAGNARHFEETYHFSEKSNEAQFIAVYPEGVKSDGPLGARTWNAGTCCDYAVEQNVDDVKFLSELIDHLTAEYKVDPKRVYATGMSNGGMMAYRLACELSDKIAAIAGVSTSMGMSTPCDPNGPVSILHIQSKLDESVPFEGGVGVRGNYFPPIDSVLNVWSGLNSCTNMPESTSFDNYLFTEWNTCAESTAIKYYLTEDGGHSWPGGEKGTFFADPPSTALNATDLIWDFFQEHRKN